MDAQVIRRNNTKEFEKIVSAGNHFAALVETKKKQDKERVTNRKDQVDKRAFQEAVKINMDDYDTKADAVRDLRIKPQFENYSSAQLEKWVTSDVWTKPKQIGRPKKK